jgi:hypothetical protein
MGLLDGIVKGLADIIPAEGNPELKAYKAQNELNDLAARENEIFARLGRQVYAGEGADNHPDIKAELDALADTRREIESRIKAAQDEADAKKQAELAEEARRCPECGEANPEGAAFCQGCGTRLAQARRFCRECGVEIAAGHHFCSSCGAKVTE